MIELKPWTRYPLIAHQLKKVNACIEQNMQTVYPALAKALARMAASGGKYLRPSLLLLAGQITSHDYQAHEPQLIKLASAIEILHMATLIHDDIIDDSDERRGAVSIQARFGKDVAVYAGDLLFTRFFDLLLQSTDDQAYLRENAHTMHAILNGELGQMDERFNLQQPLAAYLDNVKGKTAALFRLAAKEGAHFAGAREQDTQLMAGYGENLGIAFQMVDDILDYDGGSQLNKPTLEDLATGVYSLPLLLALQDKTLRAKMLPLLKKKRAIKLSEMKQIQSLIINSNVLAASRQLARKYSQKAIRNLQQLPANPANLFLQKMTQKLISRQL